MLNQSLLEESLGVLGESLAERGVIFEIVAVGGGSLLLLGLTSRPTADLDIVAFIEAGRYLKPSILPADLGCCSGDSPRRGNSGGLDQCWSCRAPGLRSTRRICKPDG